MSGDLIGRQEIVGGLRAKVDLHRIPHPSGVRVVTLKSTEQLTNAVGCNLSTGSIFGDRHIPSKKGASLSGRYLVGASNTSHSVCNKLMLCIVYSTLYCIL